MTRPRCEGKTTLLHLAVGLLRPDAGRIAVFDRPPRRRPDVLARVGFVAQDKPLYRGFTVADTMRLGAGLNPAWDQGFAARRVERLGIDPGRRVGQLSGGQRAQVALTVALGKRPRLLLLDEPVAELDPLARQDFTAAVMEEVAAGELTVVFSSHAIAELEPVCDHLVLLAAARTQLAGDLDDLLAAHRLLVGPRREVSGGDRLAGHQIIAVSHAERQTSALPRPGGRPGGHHLLVDPAPPELTGPGCVHSRVSLVPLLSCLADGRAYRIGASSRSGARVGRTCRGPW